MDDGSSSSRPTATSGTDEPSSDPQLDRPALLEKARTFLLSPSVRHEDEAAKRRFLEEKGLTCEEIDMLIRDLPPQAPPVPPRTYPLPPPSNLPALIASLFQAFTWIAGASGVLLFGYYRFILPRLTRSLGARHQLKLHQAELVGRLRGRIDELKTSQAQAYNVLSARENEELPEGVNTLADLPVNSAGEPMHSLGTVIRCAFLGETNQTLTLDDLYLRLLKHFPGLKEADETEYKHFILRELSRSRSFKKTSKDEHEYWSLQDAESGSHTTLTPTTSSTQALENLRDAISRGQRKPNAYQHTFKSLTDLTAYLSRESFAMYSTASAFRPGLSGVLLGPAEEDVRREIRGLKGLMLNRRTFAPTPYRPSPTPPPALAVVSN